MPHALADDPLPALPALSQPNQPAVTTPPAATDIPTDSAITPGADPATTPLDRAAAEQPSPYPLTPPTAALSDTLSELSPQSVAPPTIFTPPVTDTPNPTDTPLSLLPPDPAPLPSIGLTPADSATDVLMPFEVQPVLPIDSPVAPIGEVLPPMGWRDDTQLTPFSVMQLDGPSRPSSNLTKENAKQNDDQDTDLGNKPPAPPPPSEPEVRNNLLESFPELSRTDIDDFLSYLMKLSESVSLGGRLSPRQQGELLRVVDQLTSEGRLSAADISSVAAMHRAPPAVSSYDPLRSYVTTRFGSPSLALDTSGYAPSRATADTWRVSTTGVSQGALIGAATTMIVAPEVTTTVAGLMLLGAALLIGMGHQIKDITENAIRVFPMSHSDDEKAQPAVVPRADFASPDPNDPCNQTPTGTRTTKHGKESKANPDRYTGDIARTIREGRQYVDNERGAFVYWREGKAVLLNASGELITQFRNVSRKNVLKRIENGKWSPRTGSGCEE